MMVTFSRPLYIVFGIPKNLAALHKLQDYYNTETHGHWHFDSSNAEDTMERIVGWLGAQTKAAHSFVLFRKPGSR